MRKRHSLPMLTAVLLTGCAGSSPESYQPATVVEPRAMVGTLPRGDALLQQTAIEGHNLARSLVGVPPLIWDDGLADHARAYAAILARTGRFQHAKQPMGPGREGENLFMGSAGAYSYIEMIALWIGEKRYFTNGAFPAISTSGRWQDVGHYTQIVWRGTTRVGCALAIGGGQDYLVCRYAPPGNVVGLKAF
ncbi:CAP domain-containing protein [Sphingomonas bacterium]|uniref:CAP domain-containing protein n=1 Tax=Sphingomonas bacterium TaxID=1895847 RepID=UPI00261A3895|nr:CAP domain-containing protein [Sphingomonas bacterium]MDB5678938.1 serine protease [Sphingomonas bacterium]